MHTTPEETHKFDSLNYSPISEQPQAEWMAKPEVTINCPPGLQYLDGIDKLLIEQKVEPYEVFTNIETSNKFIIKNKMFEKIYRAVEDADVLDQCCLGNNRPFEMRIMDNQKKQVIHLSKSVGNSVCCFPSSDQYIHVSAPPGHRIGSVHQLWSGGYSTFAVQDVHDQIVLNIQNPISSFTMSGKVEFNILKLDGVLIGKIIKHWSGIAKEIFTDADNFTIEFPGDLDVRLKAILIGACILIDSIYFET